jgi:hypothetical protein
MWNSDLEEKVIDFYSGNPCLWDVHHKEYMIATKREDKLRELVDVLENKFSSKLVYTFLNQLVSNIVLIYLLFSERH